jgi:hypothetical protein
LIERACSDARPFFLAYPYIFPLDGLRSPFSGKGRHLAHGAHLEMAQTPTQRALEWARNIRVSFPAITLFSQTKKRTRQPTDRRKPDASEHACG